MTVTAMEDGSVGSLEDNAAKRKERLAALKRKLKNKDEKENGKSTTEEDEESLPTPLFRSYKPQDTELQENAFDQADPNLIEDKIQDSLEAGQQTTMIEELDIINLAPRKPDWDLKRDIAKKLEKLERRTARAIGEIIRERLKANTEEDLASAVKAGASYAAATTDDD